MLWGDSTTPEVDLGNHIANNMEVIFKLMRPDQLTVAGSRKKLMKPLIKILMFLVPPADGLMTQVTVSFLKTKAFPIQSYQ